MSIYHFQDKALSLLKNRDTKNEHYDLIFPLRTKIVLMFQIRTCLSLSTSLLVIKGRICPLYFDLGSTSRAAGKRADHERARDASAVVLLRVQSVQHDANQVLQLVVEQRLIELVLQLVRQTL
jgi:hypothetical protein